MTFADLKAEILSRVKSQELCAAYQKALIATDYDELIDAAQTLVEGVNTTFIEWVYLSGVVEESLFGEFPEPTLNAHGIYVNNVTLTNPCGTCSDRTGIRFGVAGEDDLAAEDRYFDADGFDFEIDNAGNINFGGFGSGAHTGTLAYLTGFDDTGKVIEVDPATIGSGISSIGLSMPSAFNVAGSPLTSNGALTVTGAGTTAQYIRGDGSLATFPSISDTNFATNDLTVTANRAHAFATFKMTFSGTYTSNSIDGMLNISNTNSTSNLNVGIFSSVAGTNASSSALAGIGSGVTQGVQGVSTSGNGVFAKSTSGNGLSALSTSGTGANIQSNTGTPISASNFSASGTNGISTLIQIIRDKSGSAVNGIGGSIDYATKASDGFSYTSNRLISKWTEVTLGARISQFIITGVDAAVTADLFTLSGSGQLKLNKYGAGTFDDTYTRLLGAKADGTVVEVDPSGLGGGGGGGGTSGIDDVLAIGQALTANRTIDLDTHALIVDNANSVTAALQIKNSNTTSWFMPNSSTAQFTVGGNITDGVLQLGSNGFVRTPYYGFPTGAFHMNTGTFNGVAAFWNTAGQLIEKAAGATNISTKTFSNNNNEVYPFEGTLLVNATGGNTNLILPDPDDGGFNVGAIMRIKKTDASANTVTIDAWTNWSSTIDGAHTKTLNSQFDDIVVQSDGSNWHVVGNGNSGGGGGGGYTPPYKSLVVYIEQSGTSTPTATVLENTVGGSVSCSRFTSPVTYYRLTLSGLSLGEGFIVNKTIIGGIAGMDWDGDAIPVIPIHDGGTLIGYFEVYRTGDSSVDFAIIPPSGGGSIEMSTAVGAQKIPIEIKVYN